jgi:hypothetical protein
MNLNLLAGLLALACASTASSQTSEPSAAPPQPTSFEFQDGDRLVLIGNTVLEREQRYGSFEPRLALALGETKVSVRNLAWSGDTVFGHARSYFGPPEEGLQRLAAHLEMLKPTVVILCYGSELAFERLGGLPDFLTGYRSLIELIRAKSPGVRVIIATPPPLETCRRRCRSSAWKTRTSPACAMPCASSPSCRTPICRLVRAHGRPAKARRHRQAAHRKRRALHPRRL